MKMQQYEEDGKVYHGAIIDRAICVPDISERVFASWDYGSAFAYLWRRFGPPFEGSDPHKDLVSYFLTTDMKGVLLYVRPCVSASTSFGYSATRQRRRKLFIEDTHALWRRQKGNDFKTPRADRVGRALERAMEELKRPTNVRDWLINIQGRCDDSSLRCVAPSKLAGYGITPDYFDKFNKEDVA